MSSKRKDKTTSAKARGRQPKGQPTPKNTPGSMTRTRHKRLVLHRAVERMTKGKPNFVTIEEKDALEILMREAGGILLEPREMP